MINMRGDNNSIITRSARVYRASVVRGERGRARETRKEWRSHRQKSRCDHNDIYADRSLPGKGAIGNGGHSPSNSYFSSPSNLIYLYISHTRRWRTKRFWKTAHVIKVNNKIINTITRVRIWVKKISNSECFNELTTLNESAHNVCLFLQTVSLICILCIWRF